MKGPGRSGRGVLSTLYRTGGPPGHRRPGRGPPENV